MYIKFGTLIFPDTIAKYFTIFNFNVIPTAFVLVLYIIRMAAVDYSSYALIVELIVMQIVLSHSSLRLWLLTY